jgi:HAD superfamily hydrolase (TIGR01490 family)
MPEPRYAFFDMDHTLTRADTGFAFLRWWARRHPAKLPSVLWRFILAPFVLAFWRLRILSLQSVKNFFFSALRGQNAALVDADARAFVQSSFDRLIKKEALAYVDALRPHYHLVLASASPEFYVQYFAERLGFAFCVGTRYGFRDELFTGRIEGKDCRGEEKVRRIAALVPLGHFDREYSIAFSDNLKADAPMLALAGAAFHVHRKKWRLTPLTAVHMPRG